LALATTTIGELNPGGPLQGTDNFVIERVGGNNFRITADEVSTFIGGGGGGHVIQDTGTPFPQQPALNFIGAGVTVADNVGNSSTDITITGAAGIAGHIIEDAGTPVPQRATLNFIGFTLTDDVGNDLTVVISNANPELITKGDLVTHAAAAAVILSVGTNGQVLTVNSAAAEGIEWATPFADTGHIIEDEGIAATQRESLNFVGPGVIVSDDVGNNASVVTISGSASPLTTQGDLFGFDLSADTRIPIGTPGQVLTVSTVPNTLIRWETPAAQFYQTVQDEGTPQTQRTQINFVGAGVVVTDIASVTTVTISGGSPLTTQGDILGRNLTQDVRFAIGTPGQVLTVVTATPTLLAWTTPAGIGDITNAANVGAGTGLIFRDKIGSILNFKSLIGGSNITIIDSADDITFNVPQSYEAIFDEAVLLPQRTTMKFAGAGVTATDFGGDTLITIPGGGASPLTTQGDLFARNLTVDDRLPIGSPNQVLAVTTITPTLMRWITLPTNFYQTVQDEGTPEVQRSTINFVGAGVSVADVASVTTVTIGGAASPLTTKGDIFTWDTGDARLPVGTLNQVLESNSADATGLRWVTLPTPFVTPLTTQGDIFARNLTVDDRLPIGAVGQILAVTTATPTLMNWVTPPTPFTNPLTTQGDIFVRNLTVDTRLPIGSPGQVLTVNTGQPTAMAWTTLAAASLTPWTENILAATFTLTNVGNIAFALNQNLSNFDNLTQSGVASAVGVLRVRNGQDAIGWRNAGDTNNNTISSSSGDVFTWQIGAGGQGGFASGPNQFTVSNDFMQIVDGAGLITLEIKNNQGLTADQVIGHHDFSASIGESSFTFVRNIATVEDITGASEDGSYKIECLTAGSFAGYISFNDAALAQIDILKPLSVADAIDIIVGTTTGTKIGTATTQKIGFWNAGPIVQPPHIPDPAGGATIDAEARAAINSILGQLAATGLQAAV